MDEYMLFELEVTRYPEGGGRIDVYRLDNTGRYYERSQEVDDQTLDLLEWSESDLEDGEYIQ